MKVDNVSRLISSRRIGNWSAYALLFALGAFGLATHAQTVGPIAPHPSAEPQQAPPQSAAPATDREAKNTLAGKWNLNRDQSDDPRQKLEQASTSGGGGGGWGQGPSAGGGGGWGGWGGGPWGGVGGRGGNGGGWNRGGRPFPDDGALDMSDFSQLVIEQSDSSAKVTGANGRVLAQYSADNSSNKDAAKKSKDSPNTPPAARWQGDELVTTANGPRGTKTTRTYELSPNGKQLFVTTRLDNPRLNQPVNIRFVYDPAGSSGN